MTTQWDVLANNKISHAIASLSTNPHHARLNDSGVRTTRILPPQAQKLEAKFQTHTREIRYQQECTKSEGNQASLTKQEDNLCMYLLLS